MPDRQDGASIARWCARKLQQSVAQSEPVIITSEQAAWLLSELRDRRHVRDRSPTLKAHQVTAPGGQPFEL